MITKNIKGKSFKGCVRYVMNETAELLEAEGVLAGNKEEIIRSFAMQRSGRRDIKQPVGHIPISFAPEDKERMTDDFMIQLAKEYMEEMDIRNTQYIIVRHHNADNEHLHIVYNRIDNNLNLISVNYDYKRNIKVCKKLKDRHKLTYGEGKDRVKREKLRTPDSVKYLLYDIIKAILPYCTSGKEFQGYLQSKGINVEFKHKRTTGEIEGISFRYDEVAFKGSQIDRKFSYGNLKKEFEKNLREFQRQKFLEQEREKTQKQQSEKSAQPTQGNKILLGIEILPEQDKVLRKGESVYIENMTRSDGRKFSSYVFLDDDRRKLFFSEEHPDTFVKYGKYEMRLRDKILIEAGQITKATVKWHGYGNYANPYLWKANKSDPEYQESWDDPRIEKKEKPENIQRQIPKNPEKKRGKRI